MSKRYKPNSIEGGCYSGLFFCNTFCANECSRQYRRNFFFKIFSSI